MRFIWFFVVFLAVLDGEGWSCTLPIDYNRLVYAIGRAENSVAHPYGIMVKYRHTTAKTACFNTVRHRYRLWVKMGRPGSFLHYLAIHYAPIRAKNDPYNLNKNWESNVRRFYHAEI